ncbi:hypothetical protein ACLESO_47270 [Pyxidicoccus sp. 3LG]
MKLMKRNLCGALLGLSLAACGPMDEAELETPASQEQELPANCTSVDDTNMTNHACVHYNNGADNVNVSSGGSVNTKHKHYTVTLPPGLGGSVTFVPSATTAGDTTESVSFYLSPTTTLTVTLSGSTVTPGISETISSGCGLSQVVTYDLTVGSTYTLNLGAVAGNQVRLVPEYLDDNKATWYRDADGDTYGTPINPISTACEPPSGYVNRRFDCNDSNPAIYNCL